MRKFLTLSGLLIGLAAALGAAALWFLIFTASGARFIAARLSRRFGTARVRIEQVSGTLATGVRAGRVVIDQRHVYVRLQNVYMRVRPSALSWRTLVSPDTTIAAAYIRIRPVPPLPAVHPQFLPSWLGVRVEHAHIDRLTVVTASGSHLSAEDIDAAARLSAGILSVTRLTLRDSALSLELSGRLYAARPLHISLAGTYHWRAPRAPQWSGGVALHGDLANLDVEAGLRAPFRAQLRGLLSERNGLWHVRSALTVRGLDLRTWYRSGRLGRISAQLALTGTPEHFTVGGTLDPAGLHAGVFHVELLGAYVRDTLTARRLAVTQLATGASATAAGTVRWRQGRPQLHLRGEWHALQWPLAGTARFTSAQGRFSLAGDLPYAVDARGVAQIGHGPQVPVRLTAEVRRTGLTVDHASLHLLGGEVRASGVVSWLPPTRWSLRARASGLDPGQVRTFMAGRIGVSLSASGEGFGPAAPLSVRISRLSGLVRGQPASGGGGIERRGGAWTFRDVHLDLGHTRLALDGRVSQQLDLRFTVAGDLALIEASDGGRFDATGVIRGARTAPRVRASLSGSHLRFRNATLQSLVAHVDFDPTSQRRSSVAVHLRELRWRHRRLADFDFTMSGFASDLHANLTARAPGLSVAAHASGSFFGGIFTGQISTFNVLGPQALRMHLSRPAMLSLSRTQSRLSALCLESRLGALCAAWTWSPARWSASVTTHDLPLATLTAGRTPTVQYEGRIGAKIELHGSAGLPAQGTLHATLADAVLSRRLLSGQVEQTVIGSGVLSAVALPGVIHAQASLTSGAIGTVDAALALERDTPTWRAMPLEGTLRLRTTRLDLISLYMPGVDQVSGVLLARAAIGGTLAHPRLTGDVRVEGGSANLYRPNLQMHQLALQAKIVQGAVTVEGTARVGQGLMHVQGEMRWRDDLPYGALHLWGSNLQIVNLPEAQIDAAPDLHFRIAGRRIDATGTVLVSRARIAPRSFAGAVSVSSDQVIVGEESSSAAHRYQVVSTITLELGKDVNIDTMGLTGRLAGHITVQSGLGRGRTATGELSVVKGRYSAYARNLTIESGRLFFRGGPIDDPGIEIRAVRRYPDVTAGINVSGTLKQPQVSFFSNPSLPQAQIMSLLLSGGGSLQALQTSTVARSQQNSAANELLTQGGALLAQRLGSRIGLPDVTLQTDLNNETSLVLGKYLSPRVYVSYGVGLTEQLSAINLRYTLGNHWTLRLQAGQGKTLGMSKSGTIGGLDLVFTVTK